LRFPYSSDNELTESDDADVTEQSRPFFFQSLQWNVGLTHDFGPEYAIGHATKTIPTTKNKNKDKNIYSNNSRTDTIPFPFKRLVVKSKNAVLSDGIDEYYAAAISSSSALSLLNSELNPEMHLDWTDAGPELEAWQWHSEIKHQHQSQQQQPTRTLLLDCRNTYESDMGTFLGATPLSTKIFSESWQKLEEILSSTHTSTATTTTTAATDTAVHTTDLPSHMKNNVLLIDKNTRILTYCTGGIRCVKINAYLKQRLGFTNIARLKNGIVGYEQWIESQKQTHAHAAVELKDATMTKETETDSGHVKEREVEQSLYIGENFLFDRRRL
jgi:predicted sulfurtransferase